MPRGLGARGATWKAAEQPAPRGQESQSWHPTKRLARIRGPTIAIARALSGDWDLRALRACDTAPTSSVGPRNSHNSRRFIPCDRQNGLVGPRGWKRSGLTKDGSAIVFIGNSCLTGIMEDRLGCPAGDYANQLKGNFDERATGRTARRRCRTRQNIDRQPRLGRRPWRRL